MSRIGYAPITIPEGVTVEIDGRKILVKGEKGELSHTIPGQITIEQKDNEIRVDRKRNAKAVKSLHGLTRALIANMIVGVTKGYDKTLEFVGTGYRVKKQGNKLTISVGYSHDIEYEQPEGITLDIEGNNIIKIQGIDKQQVGQVAAEIRKIRPPEPYKGKGIRYQGEHVRRKAGKAAKVGEGV